MAESPGGLAGKLDKYQVNFLLGQWLEVFVWGLLERNQEALGIWDVVGQRAGQERQGQGKPPQSCRGLWLQDRHPRLGPTARRE